jgi:hypothetical protein
VIGDMTTTLLFLLVECYALIIGFLCYSALKPVWRELALKWRIIFSPLALFWFADVAVRCTVGVLVFQSIPTWGTITVTELCNSLMSDTTFRGRWARSICRVLNIIQPSHCAALKI